ncbi:hypothetical protein B0I75DRAFT_138345 [Yarrowia lipolytica]|nr:hypothetical protein B0I74DRAFT_142297 [Yarrowia lipolytica]RDW52337.1 hypothetical protein B0I75DRAFT_138345 [Yarrowia lipolytica]
MDWIFSEKPDPATPPVSWALGAIPAMFRRETPHFERDLGRLRRADRDSEGARDTETTTGDDVATEPTFDNFLEMKASSTPFFKPEKVHLKRRAANDDLKPCPNKFPKTGGILKQTQTGAHGENDTVSNFGHKNVSFAASLGSTTNSISEQLPSGYEGADQTPVASCRGPKFVQYDPVNDDTKTMFRKLDNNMDLLNERRLKWGGGGSDTRPVTQHVANGKEDAEEHRLVKSTAQVELELALEKIKRLEEDKRRYMNQSNKFEMEKRTVEHDLEMLKHQQRNEIDTMKMTIEHLQSKMSVSGCETRVKEHKLNVAESRVGELQRELADTKVAAEAREHHLKEQVAFLEEKVGTLERKERAFRASEKIAMRQRDDFNKNWTFQNQGSGSQGSQNETNHSQNHVNDFHQNWNRNQGPQTSFNPNQNCGNQHSGLQKGNEFNLNHLNPQQQNPQQQNLQQQNSQQQNSQQQNPQQQPNIFQNPGNPFASTFHPQPQQQSTRQPLGSFDLNIKRDSWQKSRNIFGHNRQPSTTPKQPPPSYMRGHDVDMADGMRFFR